MTRLFQRWYILAALGVLVLVGTWWYSTRETFNGLELAEPVPAPVFQLPSADGEIFSLSDEKGKVVLMYFGYTYCPDACPATLRVYEQVADRLEDESDRVKMVFISVDPERDTPERMAEYMARFGNHVTGLVGTEEELEAVWEAYGIRAERVDLPDSALGYTVIHTTQTFLIDPDGKLRLLYPYTATAEDIEEDIRKLLRRS